MKSHLLTLLFTLLISVSYSQIDSVSVAEPDTTADEFSFFYTEEEEMKYLNYKPIIELGVGSVKFFGDVRDTYSANPIMGNTAVNIGVSRDVNDYLSVRFSAIYGSLSGNERTETRNLNFKTNFLNGSLMLTYNFFHLLNKTDLMIPYRQQRTLIPSLSIGVSAFDFSSKADLYDRNGNEYHYWTDGTIRDRNETYENEYSSVVLTRDYEYETDLRDLDIDDAGKYSKVAFAMPIDLALEYNLHERAILKFGATYYMVFNDNVDNVSSKGSGKRKGNVWGDDFLYTYASIKFDLFSNEKDVFTDATFFVSPDIIAAIKAEDEDSDGVSDVWDRCLGTLQGVKIDDYGCALDDDSDGFPNYRDEELNTQKDSITNMKGVKLTADEWQSLSDTTDAITYEEICLYYPSMCYENAKERYRNKSVEIPSKFKHLDADGDNYISLDEVSKAIDELFSMTSNLTVDEVYELTEFFFSQ